MNSRANEGFAAGARELRDVTSEKRLTSSPVATSEIRTLVVAAQRTLLKIFTFSSTRRVHQSCDHVGNSDAHFR